MTDDSKRLLAAGACVLIIYAFLVLNEKPQTKLGSLVKHMVKTGQWNAD
jgi:hypothetical protein